MEKVKVVIPIYKPALSEYERASLLNTFEVLGAYPIVLLKPQGMDISDITRDLPPFGTMEVSDEWIGAKNGIHGYNDMMLSHSFYELFADTEYILICHTDAWIFRDELTEWCDKDYDCVAAAWIRRRIYDLPIIKQFFELKNRIAARNGGITKADIYDKIGNGGLSLRRVDAFIAACDRYADEIALFRTNRHHLYNEDVFWAVVPKEFRYPPLDEALAFAFDTNPKYCYRLRGGRLPFGCHSWYKPRMFRFWRNIIPLQGRGGGTDK